MKKYTSLCIIAYISWRKSKYTNCIFFLFPDRKRANRSNVLKRVDRVDYVISLSHLYVFNHMCVKRRIANVLPQGCF